MELHHLRYVVKLAQRLHFSQAADELGITQPSLSQQVIQLEKELGLKLFERKTRSVVLTAAGEEFVAHAAAVLKEWEGLQEAMRQFSARKMADLRIGTLVNMALLDLNRHLQAFQDQHPGIGLTIAELTGSDDLLRLLEADRLDLAFVIPSPDTRLPPRFSSTVLIPGRMVAVLPVTHPLAARTSLAMGELATEKLIFPARVHTLHNLALKACHTAGFEPRIVSYSSQVRTGVDLAAKNFGVAILSSHFVAAALRPEVVALPIEPVIPRDIAMVYAEKGATTPALASFLAFLTAAYSPAKPPA